MADMKCCNIVFNIPFMILVEDAKIYPEQAEVELQPLYEIMELSSFSTWDGMGCTKNLFFCRLRRRRRRTRSSSLDYFFILFFFR